jgi:hypothetical protein
MFIRLGGVLCRLDLSLVPDGPSLFELDAKPDGGVRDTLSAPYPMAEMGFQKLMTKLHCCLSDLSLE